MSDDCAGRVHIRVPGTAPMPELMRLIQSIESAGFDGAGILNSQMISRDSLVTLGQAATHTSRMQLFPAVTNPFTPTRRCWPARSRPWKSWPRAGWSS